MNKTPLYIAVLLLFIFAIANLARFFWNTPVIVGTLFVLPGWTGAIIFILLGLLVAWAFRSLWKIPS